VVKDAPTLLKTRGVHSRVTIEAGDFFETVPVGADAYVLSHIIHDWTDEQCAAILGNCRKGIRPGGRLLIVEMVLPAGDTPHLGKIYDMSCSSFREARSGQRSSMPRYSVGPDSD
jgi:hypothetical protein